MTLLRWGTAKNPGPGFWAWAAWKDRARHGVYGPRPSVSQDVPAWVWPRYQLHVGIKPPPPPPPVPVQTSPFAGRGCFTASDPMRLVRDGIAGCFDWVALKGDGEDHATVAEAASLLLEGQVKRVHVWYSLDGQIEPSTAKFTPIFQDEGPSQREEALRRGASITGPKALVSNLWSPDPWPAGYACLPEAYWNVNPNATPGNMEYEASKRGAKEIVPVFGCYDGASEGGKRVPLLQYLHLGAWTGPSWAAYLGETLTTEDVAYLKSLPR